MASWDSLGLLDDSKDKKDTNYAPSWDSLGILRTPVDYSNANTGGIDYQKPNGGAVLGTYEAYTPPIVPQDTITSVANNSKEGLTTNSLIDSNLPLWKQILASPIAQIGDWVKGTNGSALGSRFMGSAGGITMDKGTPIQPVGSAGTIPNYIANLGGGAAKAVLQGGGTNLFAGGNMIADVIPQTTKLAQYGANALGLGANLGAYSGIDTFNNGGNLQDSLKSAGTGFLQGAGLGILGKGITDIAPQIIPKTLDTITNKDQAIQDALKTKFGENNDLLNAERTKSLLGPKQSDIPSEKLIQPMITTNKVTEPIPGQLQLPASNPILPSKMETANKGINDLGANPNTIILGNKDIKLDPKQPNWSGEAKTITNTLKPKELTQLQRDIASQHNQQIGSNPINPTQPNIFTNNPLKAQTMAAKIEQPSPDVLTGDIPKEPTNYKYVVDDGFNVNQGKNEKATTQDIRTEYSGIRNTQVATGNQLADEIVKGTNTQNPSLLQKTGNIFSQKIDNSGTLERAALTAYREAGQNLDTLKAQATDTNTNLDKPYMVGNKDTGFTYRQIYEKALNLSDSQKTLADKGGQLFDEVGQASKDRGTINTVNDNYSNHIWNIDDSAKTDTLKGGVSPYTSHSQQRTFPTMFDGIKAGYKPATMDMADNVRVLNSEMATANTNMQMKQSLLDSGIGSYTDGGKGFTKIEGLSQKVPTMVDGKPDILQRNFYVPDKIAHGLQAITDPNFLNKIDALRGLQKYQGIVKTVDLAFSTFHHISLGAQILYNNKGGLDLIKHINDLTKMGTDEGNQLEKNFIRAGGTTTESNPNFDTLSRIDSKNTIGNKILNAPIIKQAKNFSEANSSLIFNHIQRWAKVNDFNIKSMDWISKHSNATPEEITTAQRSLASEVNNAYGGLNWQALGRTKTGLAIERLALLAPDWTESSVRMLGQTAQKSAGGAAARSQMVTGLVGGAALTEALSFMFTGHGTWQNPKGHELEVEVQPGVYISMFRSGVGDVAKWGANMIKTDPLTGTMQSINGKLAPLARTIMGQLGNKQFNGAPITSTKNNILQNTLARGKEITNTFAPIPFGVANSINYNKSGEQTPIGNTLISTGAGTYSKDKSNPNNPTSSYQNNWLNKGINTIQGKLNGDTTQSDINSIQDYKSQALKNSKATNSQIQNQLKQGITPTLGTPQQIKAQQKTLDKFKQTPLQQGFGSMSRSQQLDYLKQNPDQASKLSQYLKSK